MLWDCYLAVELWKKTQTHLDDTCGAGEREGGTGGHGVHGGLVVPVGRFWPRLFMDRPEAGRRAGVRLPMVPEPATNLLWLCTDTRRLRLSGHPGC